MVSEGGNYPDMPVGGLLSIQTRVMALKPPTSIGQRMSTATHFSFLTCHVLTPLSAADATSHLFFAYLRSISPDLPRGMSGISSLPIALQTLVQATEYPPEAPTLLQVSTTKVVMIVDTVSPTPFALLRRAKNFEYRDSDHHLQEFSGCEDPIQALTDECLRVLRRIASGNQVEQTPGEKAPDNQDESWSRFEDIGFGNSLETELAEDGAAQTSDFSGGLKSAPQSSAGDLGRPTTPSWADFMSEGFTGDENLLKTPVAAPLLLPPDKKLPPLSTGRGHSSQSHKRTLDSQTDPEPGELASITNLDLDDSFWWVWISSLAGEEPATRKAVFGRCALVETIIRGAKWLVLEEQVRGAAPEPDPGAYIAEKKRFFSLSSRMGKLSRRKSSARKATPMEESYNRADNTAPLSKTSIGPDQHAKIQAAAAALQKKHREQAEGPILHGSSSKTDVSNMSHSRANHSTTPQPSILNEASHAMKWAKNYDKDAFRAAYLGDNRAGKGSTDALKPQSIEEKPSTPTSEAPSMGTPLPSVSEPEEENTPTPGTPVAQNEAAEAAEAPAPKPEAPAAPAEPTESAAPAEAAEAPVEAPAGRPSSSRPVSGTPSAGLEPTITSSPSQPKQSTDSADDSGKKLRKKTGASGFKSIFSTRKKTIENPESKPSMKPTGAETSAVAAARAALEQKAKESQEPSMRPPSGPSVLRKKPVGEGPKPSSKDADGPETVRTSESAVPVATEPVAEPTLDATQTEPEAKKSTEPEITEIPDPDMPGVPSESDDHLSRVDTLEQAAADREFSRFDQGPLVEQPAFSPDSPGSPVSPVSERSSGSTAAEEESAKASIGATSAAAAAASSDRWAQIRKNAAERAAQNQSETDSGPDYNSGDLSEERKFLSILQCHFQIDGS